MSLALKIAIAQSAEAKISWIIKQSSTAIRYRVIFSIYYIYCSNL